MGIIIALIAMFMGGGGLDLGSILGQMGNMGGIEMQQGILNDSGFVQIKDGNFISEPEPNNDGGQMPGQTVSVAQGESVPPEAPAGQQVNLADL